jgi:hypothetical protein
MMTIKELINKTNDEQLKDIIYTFICPNEFNLKSFDDIQMCQGDDARICPRCWAWALQNENQ